MDDLLKDAIADAKAVRETALENAKIALEEAFTPRLQSMLAKKIQAEIEDEEDIEGDEEDEMGDEPDMGEPDMDDEPEEDYHEDDEDPTDADSMDEPEMDMDDEPEVDDEEEMEAEGIININGVNYAPISEEEEEEDEDGNPFAKKDDEMEESNDLDLDEILKELEEEEVNEEEDIEEAKDEVEESKDDVDESKDEVEESKDEVEESKDDVDESKDEVEESKDEVEEDIDLEEIVKALSEEEDEANEANKVSKLQSELDEHRNVVKYLRSKLNEVNLLNAKLLFTNKLFRSYGLSNEQKMKVVENFDRAHNLREVKLVYSTLAESFGSNNNKTEIKESKKGSASKAVASTKSEKQEVIAEGHEMRDRFKKLAGIL